MKRTAAALLLLVTAVGCVDSANTMARDLRNLNNEVIDALMMVTNDQKAKTVGERVLAEYSERMTLLDDRFKNWDMRDTAEKANELFRSDNFALLLIENKANKDRLNTEMKRLALLQQQIGGEAPNLTEFMGKASTTMNSLRQNLDRGWQLRGVADRIVTDQKTAQQYKGLIDEFNQKLKQFSFGNYTDVLDGKAAGGQNMNNPMMMPGMKMP